MRKTELHGKHRKAGADVVERNGALIPSDYGNEAGEYRAVRESAGVIDLSCRGKLRLSGREHVKFLQGMLTNDVVKLEPGKGVYAALLTVKGRVVSDMRLFKSTDSVYLDLEPGMNVTVSELLKKFRLSYKADIDDVTGSLGLLFVTGPKAHEVVSRALGASPEGAEQYDHSTAEFQGVPCFVARDDRVGLEGYDLIADNAVIGALWDRLVEAGADFSLQPFGHNAYETLRVEAGIPRYGADMDDTTIPIEAGIWSALNFEKGCYIGQEVVARIKWRGHVNRHLTGLILEGESLASRDDEIYSGEKKIGRITSSVYSPLLQKPVALGYVRREFIDPGTVVSVKPPSLPPVPATVSGLPFSGAGNSKN